MNDAQNSKMHGAILQTKKCHIYEYFHKVFFLCPMNQTKVQNKNSKFGFGKDLKLCYSTKIGLVELRTYGGKIKFEIYELKLKFYFPAKRTQVNMAYFFRITSL